MAIQTAGGPRRGSKAWAYYAIIACLGVVAAFSQPATLIVTLAAGLYSYYLYQGGRVVIWFW